METWDRPTTCRRLQPDRATQIRVVDLGSPGHASGFLASEMDEQCVDGIKEEARHTSYSIVMCMSQSVSEDRRFVEKLELQETCQPDININPRRPHRKRAPSMHRVLGPFLVARFKEENPETWAARPPSSSYTLRRSHTCGPVLPRSTVHGGSGD